MFMLVGIVEVLVCRTGAVEFLCYFYVDDAERLWWRIMMCHHIMMYSVKIIIMFCCNNSIEKYWAVVRPKLSRPPRDTDCRESGLPRDHCTSVTVAPVFVLYCACLQSGVTSRSSRLFARLLTMTCCSVFF